MQVRQKTNKVLILVLAKDYKAATELLKNINRDYPNNGEYQIFFTSPMFDRIKAEYPPFTKALSELKMPMKLDLEKHIKL